MTCNETQDLTDNVAILTDEVKVLRESIDELKTALEWAIRNARLTIEYDNVAKSTAASPLPVELYEIGDSVTFEIDGEEWQGEIVELNDGENIATIQVINSRDLITISQDHLTRMENDPLSYRSDGPVQETGQWEAENAVPAMPGELF